MSKAPKVRMKDSSHRIKSPKGMTMRNMLSSGLKVGSAVMLQPSVLEGLSK